MGADNQQGRPNPNLAHYISGFVDGEGSFHVAVQRNSTVKTVWQVVPEFHVSQHEDNKHVLELIQNYLSCGYIKPNHRTNLRDVTWAYVVRSRDDLMEKVIPFFRAYPLRTSKKNDFEKFSLIVEAMSRNEHATMQGLKEILELAYSMNRSGKYRKILLEEIYRDLEPSETIRQTSEQDEDIVRTARRRAEAS